MNLGEIVYGKDRGLRGVNKYNKYIWHICPDCRKERWVHLNSEYHKDRKCQICGHYRIPYERVGENKLKRGDGYILVQLRTDDFFRSMCWKIGYVLEHRLVMAKHLGRCLQKWEVVHHLNGIRDDNHIDNLELVDSVGSHISNHSKGYKDGYVNGLLDGRNKQIQELKELIENQTRQIKLLQFSLMEKDGVKSI